ncbi:hypothetical protein PPSIR1_28283 [Plesiocystis pacifica SIR-1]|uniref:Phospholipid/glycerol acyltransferase domain-containing protein n=1 Tax=Plesiocystis pacifica SIR-1 TaxID=391625 RepID=A6FZS9_9BACT|nr:lysophospholipid acyltransferase family protein [Plesiocystis pacifica]EDM80885.1 hypothetical protein PPSIR1_28283 [Plesiocystis pacifica SIR-1]
MSIASPEPRSDPHDLGPRLRRRAVTVPLFWAAALLYWSLAPLSFGLALLADLARRRRGIAVRIWLFVGGYLALHLYGQQLLLWAWLLTGFGSAKARMARWTYGIQRHWAGALFELATTLFGLRWTVEGAELAPPAPALYLTRHASIIDTLVPNVFVTAANSIPLRCVVKRELLNEPCLDIAGQYIPNHFVDRDPSDSEHELAAIEALAAGLDPGEGLLIYPEGTRFTEGKRCRVIARLEQKQPELAERAVALEHTLLPRPGGTLALMRGAPQADVVIVGHEGLGGFATVADLWSGEIIGREVHVRFWRYAASELPASDEARGEWLHDRWAELDAWIASRKH